MSNNFIDNIKNKLKNIKEENNNYNNLIETSTIFENLTNINIQNEVFNENKVHWILNNCPDLNKDKANIIANLIPKSETLLAIIFTKEIKTNTEYWLVATSKSIWIANTEKYKTISYQDIQYCTIIKNNLISKIININNILLEANGNNEKINNFLKIILSEENRNKEIEKETKYLCGIVPIYQKINENNIGISIDCNKNIVFHLNNNNYKYNISEITNYELLIDRNPIITKNQISKKNITGFQNKCNSITLKITLQNTIIEMPILELDSLGRNYSINDTKFLKSMNFGKEIINKLEEISKI